MKVLSAGAAGLLALLLGFVLLLGSGSAEPPPAPPGGGGLDESKVPAEFLDSVKEAGTRCPPKVTAPIIAAQIHAESQWDPRAQSPAGAQGIAQFMPGTWATWGSDYSGDGRVDVWDPADAIGSQADLMCHLSGWVEQNLEAGTITGDPLDLTLAAYNAGEGNVLAAGGVPDITETKLYIQKIRNLIPHYSLTIEGGPVIEYAAKHLGAPYIWGGGDINGPTTGSIPGETRNGFDCSGLTQYAYYQATGGQLTLPHKAEIQATMGTHVPPEIEQMRPGDLVFFALGRLGPRVDHVGIYMGDGQMINATRPCPTCPGSVQIDDLTTGYWATQDFTVRRFQEQEENDS